MTDIIVRHAHIDDCPVLAHVLINTTQNTFHGHVPDHCLEWITLEESAANWAKNFKTEQSLNDGNYLFAAETKSMRVIGFIMLCPLEPRTAHFQFIDEGYSHELRSLQVLPAWQNKGVGKKLVSKVFDQVLTEGGNNLLVKMLVDNPNLGYYEHLGALRLGTNPFSWDGYQTQEIIFGWENISTL